MRDRDRSHSQTRQPPCPHGVRGESQPGRPPCGRLAQASRRGERPARHRARRQVRGRAGARKGASGAAAWATQSGRRPTGRSRPHADGRPAPAAALGADKSATLAGRFRVRHPCRRTPAIIHVLHKSTTRSQIQILPSMPSYLHCPTHQATTTPTRSRRDNSSLP